MGGKVSTTVLQYKLSTAGPPTPGGWETRSEPPGEVGNQAAAAGGLGHGKFLMSLPIGICPYMSRA